MTLVYLIRNVNVIEFYIEGNRSKRFQETNAKRKPHFLEKCEYFHSTRKAFSLIT